MWLARIPVADRAVLEHPPTPRSPARRHGRTVENAYHREAKIVALDIADREAILRVLDDCPEPLAERLGVLLVEHVGRVRDGLT